MLVEYDLVIIGYTIAGVHAALEARRLNARVVLVAQTSNPKLLPHSAIATITTLHHQLDRLNQLPIQTHPISPSSLNWQGIEQWTQTIDADYAELYSPVTLAAAGVELIADSGEFCRKPRSGFVVKGRVLSGRSYLIATQHRPRIPNIDGLDTVCYLTPNSSIANPPKSIAILGNSRTGVELAQLYARLGTQVTLIVHQPPIVPNVDPEVAFLLQAVLETEKIRVITGKVLQVKTVQQKVCIQVANDTIETDEILIAMSWESELETLNLESMRIRLPIQTNTKLQTKNPSVYYCGSFDPANAKYEAAIAVRNALFFPTRNAKYSETCNVAFTDPEIAWTGLTEAEAIEKYGRDVIVVRQPFKTLTQTLKTGKTTGLCKLIVRRNGQVLGAHIVGLNAGEILGTIALIIRHKIRLQNVQPIFPSSTVSEVMTQAVEDWKTYRSQRNKLKGEAIEMVLGWKRAIDRG